jgi:hypothetical protein
MASKVLAVVLCLVAAPAFAQGDLKTAPVRLSLQIASDKPGERCARSDASDPAPLVTVSLHRTFHDDFDEHPLLKGRWVPHYAGAGSLLDRRPGGRGEIHVPTATLPACPLFRRLWGPSGHSVSEM